MSTAQRRPSRQTPRGPLIAFGVLLAVLAVGAGVQHAVPRLPHPVAAAALTRGAPPHPSPSASRPAPLEALGRAVTEAGRSAAAAARAAATHRCR